MTGKPASDWAVLAADKIFQDICGRKAIGDELEMVEESIQDEMREKWAKIIDARLQASLRNKSQP